MPQSTSPSPFILRKGFASIADLKGGMDVYGMGVGNVYYVIQTTNDDYTRFVRDKQDVYSDGTSVVHSTIQAALDACVAERNDYVVVSIDGSDYDLTAALTMTKKGVHLICPAGLGANGIGMNAARIHQETASTACITVTADCVEIAGLFFKGASDADIITLSGTRWHANIHDNFFGQSASSAGANSGIVGTGACSHMSIHHNFFNNYGPTLLTGTNNTMTGFITLSSGSCTRGIISDNYCVTGANTTVAAGINFAGVDGMVLRNYLWESAAVGSQDAGVLTLGISTGANNMVADNRIGIATEANGVSGGTANSSYVTNYEGTSGGTLLT